jgi:hypothetical protein
MSKAKPKAKLAIDVTILHSNVQSEGSKLTEINEPIR